VDPDRVTMTGMEDELKDWIRKQLDDAVEGLIDANVFEAALIEVKPAWVLPLRILVGKAREQADPINFRWFICGEVGLDYIPAETATTPRDAVRHFSMKWQMDASNRGDLARSALVEDAEALYSLAEDDRFWP
jgi:Domain of unknown function (DUF4826)